MSPIPRIARVPLTTKQPEACPHCGGHNLTRRGTRKKKLEIVQLWRCSSCKRVFTPGPAALHNKTYPLRMILSALTDYDLGYTLEETAARLKKKAHRRVSPSTITSWLDEYKQHCSYRRLRADGLTRFPANQTIRSIKLYHRQIYGYAFHRPKLEFLRAGTLDDKRPGDTRFAPVADFLESIPTTCPHDLFRRDDDPKARASQATPAWADVSRIIVNSQTERGHRDRRAHHPGRRQQQAASRDAAALHARQRQRDGRDRDSDLARRARHRRSRDDSTASSSRRGWR